MNNLENISQKELNELITEILSRNPKENLSLKDKLILDLFYTRTELDRVKSKLDLFEFMGNLHYFYYGKAYKQTTDLVPYYYTEYKNVKYEAENFEELIRKVKKAIENDV